VDKKNQVTRRQWIISVILATSEVEIGRMEIQGGPRQKVCETLSPKKPEQMD
jgi:hypothetical protein